MLLLHSRSGHRKSALPTKHQEKTTQVKWRKTSGLRNHGADREHFHNPSPPLSKMIEKPTPTPYAPSLKPLPSDLRPHVLARDRLRLWWPVSARNTLDQHGTPTNLTTTDLERVKDVLEGAWADSTKEAYGAGLLIFHVFCDWKNIPDEQRAPASPLLISAFISTITGACSGKSINNYVHGIRAWHVLHGVEWRMDTAELSTLLKAADKATPLSSRRSKRTPFTIDFILTIHSNLDLSTPLHAAVFACLTTTFYTAS